MPDKFVITPWEVQGNIDYSKLIKELGLYYKVHYPHFIIVTKKLEDKYEIIDPYDGLVKHIEKEKLSKAIISLKNHLWFSPQVIQIR